MAADLVTKPVGFQHHDVAQIALQVNDFSHELQLLDDFLKMFVRRQEIDLVAHLAHEVLPRHDRELRQSLAPVGQTRQHPLEEAGGPGKALFKQTSIENISAID